MTTQTPAGLTFHVPPTNQGQIVERSYALSDDGHVYRRTLDRSDRSVTYSRAEAADSDEGDYWNGAPTVAGEWTECSAPSDEPTA